MPTEQINRTEKPPRSYDEACLLLVDPGLRVPEEQRTADRCVRLCSRNSLGIGCHARLGVLASSFYQRCASSIHKPSISLASSCIDPDRSFPFPRLSCSLFIDTSSLFSRCLSIWFLVFGRSRVVGSHDHVPSDACQVKVARRGTPSFGTSFPSTHVDFRPCPVVRYRHQSWVRQRLQCTFHLIERQRIQILSELGNALAEYAEEEGKTRGSVRCRGI